MNDKRSSSRITVQGICYYRHSEASMPHRQVIFVGSSQDDLRSFPEDVKDLAGYALWLAQRGEKHPDAKPLRGLGGAGVIEIAVAHGGDAFRVVYAVTLPGVVYVL